MCPCRSTNQSTADCRVRRIVRFTPKHYISTNKPWHIRSGSHISGQRFLQEIKCSLRTSGNTCGKRTSRTEPGDYATLKRRSTSYVIRPMHQQQNKTLMTRMNYCTDLQVPREMTSCSMCRLSKISRLGGKTLYPYFRPTKKTFRQVWCINHGRKPY